MREAIEEVMSLAAQFWKTNECPAGRDPWEKRGWQVRPLGRRDSDRLQIAVLGPSSEGNGQRGDVFVYSRNDADTPHQ
jgi:hypothetical protein